MKVEGRVSAGTIEGLQKELQAVQARIAASRILRESSDETIATLRESLTHLRADFEALSAHCLGLQRQVDQLQAQNSESQRILTAMGPTSISVATALSQTALRFPKIASLFKVPLRAVRAALRGRRL